MNIGTRVPSLDVYQTCSTVKSSGLTPGAFVRKKTLLLPVATSYAYSVDGTLNDAKR